MMEIVLFFLTSRGVRQDGPISPILFNFVANVFTKMLMRAATNNQLV
jgi:Fe-S cluster assembly scaffold protein SufB